MRFECHAAVCLLLAAAVAGGQTTAIATRAEGDAGSHLPVFTPSRHFGERVHEYRFEPEVKIHINAPGESAWRDQRPVHLVIYALPNGNTTAQTIGKLLKPGIDWRYGIQHIGAQVRRLREVIPDENLVVAYVEADGRSWPAWKGKDPQRVKMIPRVVESIRSHFGPGKLRVSLSGHSGGGSFIFGYIDAVDSIPDSIGRIAFLDANYGYNAGHGDKIASWLKTGEHFLNVLAYDDRNVLLDGKPIVSPTGGTWRRTEDMLTRLQRDFSFAAGRQLAGAADAPTVAFARYRALDGRIDIIMHRNPDGKILHTALVGDMGGFMHALTAGTRYEGLAGTFKGPITYRKWIQPD